MSNTLPSDKCHLFSAPSSNFPTTCAAFSTSFAGGTFDAFVVKLNSTGSALINATFLGGSGLDAGEAIAIDGAGNAYVTGPTGSADFPTTAGALDTSFSGGPASSPFDNFVTKIDVSAAPPQTVIGTIISNVNALVAAGVLTQGQGNALIAKLQAAIQQLASGNVGAAINELQAFLNQVNALVKAGVLSQAQASALIKCGNQTITSLSS